VTDNLISHIKVVLLETSIHAAADHIRFPIHMDSKLMTKFHITNCALILQKQLAALFLCSPATTSPFMFSSHSAQIVSARSVNGFAAESKMKSMSVCVPF